MTTLSDDAIIFGLAYLNGPKAKLSFGGEGAEMEITPRARAALDELLTTHCAVPCPPTDQIMGREHYRGVVRCLALMARERGIQPFDQANAWPTFVKKGTLDVQS